MPTPWLRAKRVTLIGESLVEGHDVEKTGISVDDMISKEGKNSYGQSHTFTIGKRTQLDCISSRL